MQGAEQADDLVELFAACQRILAHLGEGDEQLAEVVRDVCAAVERRLVELGLMSR